MALPFLDGVCWRALLHTLVVMQEERLFTGQAVSGVPLTRGTAKCTGVTQLAYRVTPVEVTKEISSQNSTLRCAHILHTNWLLFC